MLTFLIADDSQGKRMFLEALVQKSGIAQEILLATNTDKAKELIDTKDINAAFIDYEMPRENGPAVVAYLREKAPNAHIAIVSSSNSDQYQSDALSAGANTYICTSFEEEVVVASIVNLLEEWK